MVALFVSAMILLSSSPIQTTASGQTQDTAAIYKTKCAMCHGQKAEKKFDTTKTCEQLVEAIMKGVATSTPKMPSYEKTLTVEQAQALVTYMKELKSAPPQ